MWPRDCPAEFPTPSPIYKMYKRLSLKSSSLIPPLIEKYTVIICQNLFALWTKTLHVYLLFLLQLHHHFAGLDLPSCPVQKYTIFVVVIENPQKTITHLLSTDLCPCLELKKWDFTGILWAQHPVWTGQRSRTECTTCKNAAQQRAQAQPPTGRMRRDRTVQSVDSGSQRIWRVKLLESGIDVLLCHGILL